MAMQSVPASRFFLLVCAAAAMLPGSGAMADSVHGAGLAGVPFLLGGTLLTCVAA